MAGIFRISTIGENGPERDTVQIVREGDALGQTGKAQVHGSFQVIGTREELEAFFGGPFGTRDKGEIAMSWKPIAKSKSLTK